MNEGDGGSFGGSEVPALARKVELVVGVDPALQVERQRGSSSVAGGQGRRTGR